MALAPPAAAAPAIQPTDLTGLSVVRVSAHRGMAAYAFRFSERAASLYRREVAGHRLRIGCSTLSAEGTWATVKESTTRTLRAPRRRSTLRLEAQPGFQADACYLTTGNGAPLELPLTPLGRRHVDERGAFITLVVTGFFATKASGKPATVAEAVAAGHGTLVALAGPDAAPPAGLGGYWTDGKRWVFASVTAAGRRMFLEGGLDGVVRTNVLDFLQADDDDCDEDGAISPRDGAGSCGPPLVLGGAA